MKQGILSKVFEAEAIARLKSRESLYALGMSYEAIEDHLADMYGLEVSAAKISLISDKLMPVITEWRNRPL